jgi:Flp pilus assembly pilin Flp
MRFVRDERAAEVTELGLVLALVVAGSIALLTPIGAAVQGGYQTVVNAVAAA